MTLEKDHLLIRIDSKPKYLFLVSRGVGQENNGNYKKIRKRGDLITPYILIQDYFITSRKNFDVIIKDFVSDTIMHVTCLDLQ